MTGHIGTSAVHVLDATKAAGRQIGAVAKEKILAKIESTKVAAKGIASEVTQQINHGVDVTTDYVKERPRQSVAVAAGIGILLGMLISRR